MPRNKWGNGVNSQQGKACLQASRGVGLGRKVPWLGALGFDNFELPSKEGGRE